MCLLPCFGATALASYKVKKTVDKAFSSKKPEPPTEPAFVTEAKLRWNLTGWKPSSAAATPPTQPEAPRSKRSDRWGDRQQSSKQRLAELVDQHKNKQQQAPSQQQASRR